MSLHPSSASIIIASHISNPKRIGHLMECLHSLIHQSVPIAIYLSISFESTELRERFASTYSEHKELQSELLYIWIKTSKTPQMLHMHDLLPLISKKHEWIMFCDDDDTYEPNRVLALLQTILNCSIQITAYPGKKLIGVYESTFGKVHQEQRHEFWCYCIHISMLTRFMDVVRPFPDILHHKCCDVLFGEYLRRVDPNTFLYGTVTDKYYNYRVDNNSDSITGEIQQRTKLVRPAREITDSNRAECAAELNEYLNKNIEIYIHDTYVRTIIGNSFDEILQNEFKSEYLVLPMIDTKHILEIHDYHTRLRDVANQLYFIKI
jgi:glycosyltransferase involved in cell wall biosynthesis